MRRALAVSIALAVSFAAGTTPASAEPASSSGAYAYGALGTGLVSIGPLVPAGPVAQPPDADATQPGDLAGTLLTVPLGSLALAGVVGSDAHAHRADDIVPVTGALPVVAGLSDPVANVGVNAQGLARTAGVGVAFSPPPGVVLDPVTIALDALPGLLTAQSVTAEATAKCVNNQPVYDTGFEIVGLGGVVGGVLEPTVQTLVNTLLNLLGPGSVLSDVIRIERGVVTALPNGIAIDGLVVISELLDLRIAISHAEAFMPANCSVAPPTTVQPTGPGDIAPQATLATTGSDFPYVPLAIVLLGSALVLRRVTRRSPERSSIG